MTYKSLTLDINNNIAHITLNRPDKFNTMTMDFWKELPEVLHHINDEASARVVVLSSTGKHFTAGMDLSVFTSGSFEHKSNKASRRNEDRRRKVLQLQAPFNLLETIRMPVLAAIQGGCIGGGVDMIAACDSRYCTEDAFFSLEEIKIGMTADLGTLQRLPHFMPHGLLRELAYTGRRMPASEAKEFGLVNKVFTDQETMLEYVMTIAEQIAGHSPLAVAGCKEMITYARDHTVAESLNCMSIWQSGMLDPEDDMMETFKAKQEKRNATFEKLGKITPVV